MAVRHSLLMTTILALAVTLTPHGMTSALSAMSASTPAATIDMAEYKAADALIKEEKYDEAIVALNALKKPEDPDVLNLLGYAHRKAGKVDESIAYYLKGLQIAPKHKGIHEYLGEAYLMKKDVGKAEEIAGKLKELCGEDECKEYDTLLAAIEKHKKVTEGS